MEPHAFAYRDQPLPNAPPPAICAADFAFTRNASAAACAVPFGDGCARLLGWVEWKPGRLALVPSAVFRDVVDFARKHGAERVYADGHARESAREVFDPAGLVFERAPHIPAVAFLAVRTALTEGRIAGLAAPGVIHGLQKPGDAERLLARQLESARGIHEPGGHTRIELPTTSDGRHGDVAAAVVLALWAALRSRAAVYAPPVGARVIR